MQPKWNSFPDPLRVKNNMSQIKPPLSLQTTRHAFPDPGVSKITRVE